jgi:hypothetical protein
VFAPHPDTGPLAWAVALLIHLALPAAGVLAFVRLTRRMARAGVSDPPVARLFMLFATYGGWLLVGLTGLFWYWSGMASAGVAYLLLVAPLVALGIAAATFRRRAASPYHRATFWAAALYAPAVAALWAVTAALVR